MPPTFLSWLQAQLYGLPVQPSLLSPGPPSTTSLTLRLNDLNFNEGPVSVTADEKLQDINKVAVMLAMTIGPKDPDPYHPEGSSQGYNISGQHPLLTFHQFSIRTLKNITDVLPSDLDFDNEAGFIDKQQELGTQLKAAVICKHVASAHMDSLSVRKVLVVDLHVAKSRWVDAAIPKYVIPPSKKMVHIWWDEVTLHLIVDESGVIFGLLARQLTDSSWSIGIVCDEHYLLHDACVSEVFSEADKVR
ncbi:hypothetical protein FISHEDRAFT_57254 [Fistulina hepatica ATCC 64428]|nr:hypothetical protein FISHEDRAFT_57254 [Fistulina hepatica ATCC 64428]